MTQRQAPSPDHVIDESRDRLDCRFRRVPVRRGPAILERGHVLREHTRVGHLTRDAQHLLCSIRNGRLLVNSAATLKGSCWPN